MRDYLTPVKMAPSKRREMTNAGKDVENRESLYTVGGVGKLYNQYRKEHGRSSENWKQNYHMMWQFCFWDKEMRRDSKIISAPPIVALFPIVKTWKHEMPTDVWIDKKIMRFICIYIYVYIFPGGSAGKEPACQCRRAKRCRFDPWVRKIPWRRARQPTRFLPWRTPWTEEPGRLQSMGLQELDMPECRCTHTHVYFYIDILKQP